MTRYGFYHASCFCVISTNQISSFNFLRVIRTEFSTHVSVSDDNSCSLTLKMGITNVMFQGVLGCRIDLKELVLKFSNMRYQPQRVSGIVWQHRKIGGNCLGFSSGKLNCAGKCSTVHEGIQRLRRYTRLLHRSGYPVKPCGVRVITTSATHQMNGTINPRMFQEGRCYVPEIFAGLMSY